VCQTVKVIDNQHFNRQKTVSIFIQTVKLVDCQLVMRQPTKNVVG